MRDAAYAFGFDDADGESPQSSDVFWAVPSAYTASVFVIVPIDNVMTAVFDAPVATVGGEHALGVSLLGGAAGDAVGDFTGVLAVFFIGGFSLDDKRLSDVGKVEIGIEFGCGPDFTDFDAAVIRRIAQGKVRLLAVIKI